MPRRVPSKSEPWRPTENKFKPTREDRMEGSHSHAGILWRIKQHLHSREATLTALEQQPKTISTSPSEDPSASQTFSVRRPMTSLDKTKRNFAHLYELEWDARVAKDPSAQAIHNPYHQVMCTDQKKLSVGAAQPQPLMSALMKHQFENERPAPIEKKRPVDYVHLNKALISCMARRVLPVGGSVEPLAPITNTNVKRTVPSTGQSMKLVAVTPAASTATAATTKTPAAAATSPMAFDVII